MDTAIDLSDETKALDLGSIRFQLVRHEDTIIFHLIERLQFPLNRPIYVPGGVAIPDSKVSLLDWMLQSQERLHSLVRRYQSPDEYPFFPDALETPILAPIQYPHLLHPNDVNINDKLKRIYIEQILPEACASERPDRGESKENYGSSTTADVLCLQSLSRRIHFGKFVAEAKFRKETERFVNLIKNKDIAGIEESITDRKVEQRVLERLRRKAEAYGRDPEVGAAGSSKINVDAVVAMYKDYVIPMTKEVEVDYLLQRLRGTEWE